MEKTIPRSAKFELTISAIDAFEPPPESDFLIWDTKLAGFGLRIRKSGTRSFVLIYRNRFNRSRWLTLAKYGVKTPAEARALARSKMARLAEGLDPADERDEDRRALNVRELCEDYLEKAEQGLLLTKRGIKKSCSTLYTDRGRVIRHIVPLLGNRPAREITHADIVRFIRDVTAGKTRADIRTKSRGRSRVTGGAGTAARTVGLLGAIFTYGVQEGIVEKNPVTGVIKPRDQSRSVRLDREGYRALGQALGAAEARGENAAAIAAARLLALTGARRSEIVNLRWKEVDLPAQLLRLQATKTGASIRPIGRPAVQLLAALKEAGNGEFVFPAQRVKPGEGGPPHEAPFGGFPKAWTRLVAKTELEDLTPHGLRHAFAGACDDLDLSIVSIGLLMGHAGAGGMTGRYISKADAVLTDAANRVATWIDSAMRDASAEVFELTSMTQ